MTRISVDNIDGVLRRVEGAAMLLAALMLLAIMHIVVVDVIGRYVFNSPLPWAFDFISDYAMVITFFLAVGPTLQRNEHINVDVFAQFLNHRFRHACSIVTYGAAMFFLLIMIDASVEETWIAWRNHDLSIGILAWPTWTSKVFVPVGLTLLGLRMFLVILRFLLLAVQPCRKEK